MLKIKQLTLKNLQGLVAGLGKHEVTIDFTKGKNRKIMLLGDNGSGKTVLLSSLNPYRDTNDSRKVEPTSGKTGLKEITYEYNGATYVITHYYGETSAKNKSYISRDGVELNENGNIRPCVELIEEELNISQDYFAVGRLGSNVSNFIDYSTTERKKYINKFIPNIDEYTTAYDIVNSKLSDLNKRLKSINVRLEKYKDLEELAETRAGLQVAIDNAQADIIKAENDVAHYVEIEKESRVRLADISDEIVASGTDIAGDNIVDIVINAQDQLDTYTATLDALKVKYPKVFADDVTLNDIKSRIPTLNTKAEIAGIEIRSSEEKLLANETQIKDLAAQINTKEARINSFNIADLSDLEEDLETYDSKIKSLEESLIDIEDTNPDLFTGYIKESLTNEETREDLEFEYKTLHERYNNHTQLRNDRDITMYETYGTDPVELLAKIKEIETTRDEVQVAGNGLMAEIEEIHRSSGLLDILEHSEHSDHAADCPFVPMALDFKTNEYASLGEMETKLTELEDEYKTLDQEYRDLTHYYESLQRFNETVVKTYERNFELFDIVGITDEDISVLFVRNFFDIEKKMEALPIFKSYNLATAELVVLKDKYSNVEEKIAYNRSYQESIEAFKVEIAVAKDKIDKLTAINDELNNNLQTHRETRTRSLATIKVLETIVQALENVATQTDLVKVFAKYQEEVEQINATKNTAERVAIEAVKSKETRQRDKNSFTQQLEQVSRDYYTVETSRAELGDINSVLDYFKVIKDALDLKKGIPLIFTTTYLLDIAERTNELLAIAYQDAFSIEFVVTKKDFNIIVHKSDGTSLEDISLASQGEIAMTNTSLSLAMMTNVTTGYNILYLDEVDATLDNNNRRNFMTVLDKQIETLGSEQAFIISHNNEFYSADVDLILLKGYENKININDDMIMANKTVLYKN